MANHDDLLLFELANQKQRKRLKNQKKKALIKKEHVYKLSKQQEKGQAAEHQALEYLQQQGLRFIGANLNCPQGEIDLVMRQQQELVFIEIRSRKNQHFGGAAASINQAKQNRIKKAAAHFLPLLSQQFFHGVTPFCRYDVVCLEDNGLTWYKQAFV